MTLTLDRGATIFEAPSRRLTFTCPPSENWRLVGTVLAPGGSTVAGDRLTLPGVPETFSAEGAYVAAKYGAFGLSLLARERPARARKGGGR